MKDTTKIKVEHYIDKVNNHLLSFLSGKPLELYQASTHYLKSGGKRLRPLMVIKSCEMFGGNQQDALPAAWRRPLRRIQRLTFPLRNRAAHRRFRADRPDGEWRTSVKAARGGVTSGRSLRISTGIIAGRVWL